MSDRSTVHLSDDDAALWRFMQRSSSSADRRNRLEDNAELGMLRLLGMTEALIAAHKTARADGDDLTMKLIEEALRHVGGRLEKESVARHAADRRSARAG